MLFNECCRVLGAALVWHFEVPRVEMYQPLTGISEEKNGGL